MTFNYNKTKWLKRYIQSKSHSLLFLVPLFMVQGTVYAQFSTHQDRIDGVYFNIEQFIKNEPETVGFRIYDTSKKKAGLNLLLRDKRYCSFEIEIDGLADEIWGFAVEGKSYINYEGCYFPIAQYGELCTFYFLHKSTIHSMNTDQGWNTSEKTYIEEKVLVRAPMRFWISGRTTSRLLRSSSLTPISRIKRSRKKKLAYTLLNTIDGTHSAN